MTVGRCIAGGCTNYLIECIALASWASSFAQLGISVFNPWFLLFVPSISPSIIIISSIIIITTYQKKTHIYIYSSLVILSSLHSIGRLKNDILSDISTIFDMLTRHWIWRITSRILAFLCISNQRFYHVLPGPRQVVVSIWRPSWLLWGLALLPWACRCRSFPLALSDSWNRPGDGWLNQGGLFFDPGFKMKWNQIRDQWNGYLMIFV